MPHSKRPPSYRLHKARNCAVVTINGKNHYLGPYGSPESYEKYARVLAGWKASNDAVATQIEPSNDRVELSVNGLLLAYWEYAKDHYSKEGKPTKELECMREALRPLRHLCGHSMANEFGPKALKAVRQHMIEAGLSRGLINRRVGRIKRVFKWAVAEELVPPSAYHALQAITGLQYGRTKARETEPIRPVPLCRRAFFGEAYGMGLICRGLWAVLRP